jgi:hypothetical protein
MLLRLRHRVMTLLQRRRKDTRQKELRQSVQRLRVTEQKESLELAL